MTRSTKSRGRHGIPRHVPRSTRAGPRRPRLPSQLGVALAAAREGHYVFPLWPRSKTPAMHGKNTCRGDDVCTEGHQGWEQRATRDTDLIRAWWRAAPTLGIGIATGPSGLYVVDLDT